MPHRLIQQRRGKGSPTFTASKNAVARLSYPSVNVGQEKKVFADVVALRHDVTKTSVLAELLFEDHKRAFVVASEGLFEGQRIEIGKGAQVDLGNVL